LRKKKENLVSADSTTTVTTTAADDSAKAAKKAKKLAPRSPKKAASRSAIIPGWGQVYNRSYWKVPIVYAALGVTTYILVDNLKTYREYRSAYTIRYNSSLPPPDTDSTGYDDLEEIYKTISPESIRAARDQFRRYIDYSVLFFLVFWGLNVVDASVDAHLKSFDVSPDLTFNIKPCYSEMAGTSGLSLVLNIGKKRPPLLTSRF
jgi:hypothetical protein